MRFKELYFAGNTFFGLFIGFANLALNLLYRVRSGSLFLLSISMIQNIWVPIKAIRNVNNDESTFRASQKYILCPTKVHFVVVSIFNAYST